MENSERRVIGEVHVRSEQAESSDMIVEGYAVKFDTWSIDLPHRTYGKFKERIEKTAFEGADMSDVPVLVNHDENLIVGRSTNGVTEMKVDDVGLYFKVKLPNTTVGKDLYENVRTGNITMCSITFISKSGDLELIEDADGSLIQVVKKMRRVKDISLVTYPAYRDTNVGVASRSLEKFEEQNREQERLNEVKSKLVSLKLKSLQEEVEYEY